MLAFVRRFLPHSGILVPLLGGIGSANDIHPGDLVLYSPAINGISSGSGAILDIDPSSGTVSTMLAIHGATQSVPGSLVYDAFRDRLVFVAQIEVADPVKLWMMDRSGALADLGTFPGEYSHFTSGAGGKIYLRSSVNGLFAYLDASNVHHTLMDASGAAPFSLPSTDLRKMLYDAGTNSLFMAGPSGDSWSCGSSAHVNVHRVRLSDDGTRALAVDGCTQVAVDPAGNDIPVGLSHAPNGKILITVDTNSGGPFARLSLIDPVTLAVTPYASTSNTWAAATNGGTYSSVLGKAVILDTGGDTLIAFAQNENGPGTPLTAPGSVSSPGSSHETATLVEIPPAICSAQIATYCTAKVSSSGCVPQIATGGCPSFSAGSGFVISASQVEMGKSGIFFYGQQGQTALPFQGGWLCVQPPRHRTPITSSGGTTICGGVLAIDFNAWAAAGSDAALAAGSTVCGQFWFRDGGSPSGTGLSNAVRFTLAP